MGLLTAYRVAEDAVNVDNLNPDILYAFFYANGAFADEAAVHARCPHATLCGITVGLPTLAGMCDCEAGDLTVAQAKQYVEEAIAAKIYKPRVYANLDRWENQGLLAELESYGDQIRRAVANFDGIPVIPPKYNGKQYSTNGVDIWVCDDEFFDTAPPAPPKPAPTVRWASAELQVSVPEGSTGILRFNGTFDVDNGVWGAGGDPGKDVQWSGSGGGQWRVTGEPWNQKPAK